jgi:DNA polymerase/3'-5' exonuclease PolX
MRYEIAAKMAVDACKRLQPFCEVINIAGSLRRVSGMANRNAIDIKDIDLICVPRFTEVVALDLFGTAVVPEKKVSINFSDTIKTLGTITKGQPDGRYMSLVVRGHKLDIFMPDPVDYYRQYCIRTGSADYVHYTIAKAWNALGWCGTDQGLRRIKDCRQKISAATVRSSVKWEIVNQDGERPAAWQSEEHFFDWLGVDWIAPRFRTV